MDSRSQTASSNLNALETLRYTLLLSEGFWARSAVGHSSETLHGHFSVEAPLPAGAHTNMHTHTVHKETHRQRYRQHIRSIPTAHSQALQRIQSHREIWPYRPNWIVVIPCLPCFGGVRVGLGDILPSWAGLLMQNKYDRDLRCPLELWLQIWWWSSTYGSGHRERRGEQKCGQWVLECREMLIFVNILI